MIATVALTLSAAGMAQGATVTFSPDTLRVLRNPLQGWVMYLGRNWDENFWDEQGYDNMKVPGDTATVRVSDYAGCAYIRTSWASFEPEEGRYAWNDPDCRLMKLLKSVRDRGLRVAFRIVVDGRDQGQNTPQYVFDAGAQGYYDPKNPGKNRSPYPDDPVFQEKYAKFFREFARHYDNPEEVEFIDAYSLGKWGESHSMIYRDPSNKQKVFDWITDLAAESFKRVPMLIHYHRMLGDPADDGWGSVPADAEKLISTAVAKGFSLRHDAYGMKNYYKDWERNYAKAHVYQRPLVAEGGWVESSHGGSIKSDGYADHAEVRRGEFNEAKNTQVNMMDLRYSNSMTSGETWRWFNNCFDLVKEFISEGGYRLYPDKISLPRKVSGNGNATFVHRWSNLGWGYCPTNIPQWNQKYKVAFALLDKGNDKPVKVYVDEVPCLNEWIKGKPSTYETTFNLGGVPAGSYTWAVGLVDTTKDNEIGLRIAAKTDTTEDGWVKLGDATVN